MTHRAGIGLSILALVALAATTAPRPLAAQGTPKPAPPATKAAPQPAAPAQGATRADSAAPATEAASATTPAPATHLGVPRWAREASTPRVSAPSAAEVAAAHELGRILRLPYGDTAQTQGLERIRSRMTPQQLAQILDLTANDPAQGELKQANAILTLRDLGMIRIGTAASALHSTSPLVRASAVAALRAPLRNASTEKQALKLLQAALHDADVRVQTKALETLSGRDAPTLRAFLAGDPPAQLRPIAAQLLASAEEGGAALVPADSTGVLSRTSLAGVRVDYHPVRRWPDWNSSAGELTVTPAGGKPVKLADEAEVVGDVIPAAVSGDGRYVAYEAGRKIHVRDLSTGQDRLLGDGIAPRTVPLTGGFVFFVQLPSRTHERDGDPLQYDVHFAPYAGGEARSLGVLDARTKTSVNGNASPVRWMRLVEQDGGFALVGEGVKTFELTDLDAGTQ